MRGILRGGQKALPHDPESRPMTKKPLQVYETPNVRVSFDPNICLHSGVCLQTLPKVFDVSRLRWLRPDLADPADVVAAVAKCPSGALKAQLVTGLHQSVERP